MEIELRKNLWDFVRELRSEGITVLLTTHYLEEAENLCDRVGILRQGELMRIGPTGELVQQFTQRQVVLQLKNGAWDFHHSGFVGRTENVYRFQIPARQGDCELLSELGLAASEILDLRISEGNLEEALFASVGRFENESELALGAILGVVKKRDRTVHESGGADGRDPADQFESVPSHFRCEPGAKHSVGERDFVFGLSHSGLVMMGCLNNAFQNSSSSIVSAKFSGDLEDLRVSPLSEQQMIWALSIGGLVRGVMVGAVTFLSVPFSTRFTDPGDGP